MSDDLDTANPQTGGKTRSYLDVTVPHFHICNRSGPDEGPLFYQYESHPIRDMVLDHITRLTAETDR